MEEIEVKFLEIDPTDVEERVLKLGGKKIYDRVFRDRVFDYQDWPLDRKFSWLRLRDKGDKMTLSFKQRIGVRAGQDDKGMEEVEIKVEDFERTTLLLEKIGMVQKFNEEKRRVHMELDGVDVDIDWWPLMPAYLELEGESIEKLKEVADRIGLDWEKRRTMGAMQLYRERGIEEKDYSILTFSQQVKR